MKTLFLIFLLSFSILVSAQELTVHISNLKNNQGQVVLLLYKKGQDLDIKKVGYRRYIKPANYNNKVSFIINDFSKGEYAFLVYHDENKNGKFDTNWIGMPKEGIGKSGVQHKRPNFENSKFILREKKLVFNIELKYLL